MLWVSVAELKVSHSRCYTLSASIQLAGRGCPRTDSNLESLLAEQLHSVRFSTSVRSLTHEATIRSWPHCFLEEETGIPLHHQPVQLWALCLTVRICVSPFGEFSSSQQHQEKWVGLPRLDLTGTGWKTEDNCWLGGTFRLMKKHSSHNITWSWTLLRSQGGWP